MDNLKKITKFIEYDINSNITIEPQHKFNDLKSRLFETIKTHNPKIIVKAGIGNGALLKEIVFNTKAYIVVVEPSFDAIINFIKANQTDKKLADIKFINGEFHEFPVDYYAADMLICTDYMDFFDSGQSLNEFRRALQFEGILFTAGVVLDSNDLDGIYDDFIKIIFPLHNDYYLPEDYKTFLDLKEFALLKSDLLIYKNNLYSMIDYFKKIFPEIQTDKAREYISTNEADFKKFLNLDSNHNIDEPYLIGIFKRKKLETKQI